MPALPLLTKLSDLRDSKRADGISAFNLRFGKEKDMARTTNGEGGGKGRGNVTSGKGEMLAPKGRKLDAADQKGGYKTGPTHGGPPNGGLKGHAVQNPSRMPC